MPENVNPNELVQVRVYITLATREDMDKVSNITGLDTGALVTAAWENYKQAGLDGLSSAIEQDAKRRVAALKAMQKA